MTHILLDIPLDPASVEQMRALPGVTLELLPPGPKSRKLPPEILRNVLILLCKRPPLNFDDLQSLEVIQLATVGYEHLRHLGFAERSVRVCNARGMFDSAIAEWNLAMMVNLTRDLRAMIRNQERAVWELAQRFQEEIYGRVVGLWGYGGIGRETARLARAFGMTVHVLARSPIGPRPNVYAWPGTGDPEGVLPHRVFTPDQERDFLAGLDFLILALPHTRNTTGLVGETQLRALPRTAFILNPARGLIIQEQALLTALREGWIAGAALDTHFAYPLPPEHPLWGMPNVILTPHVSGADNSRLYPMRMGRLCLENVSRYLAGQPLLNEISRAEWREAQLADAGGAA